MTLSENQRQYLAMELADALYEVFDQIDLRSGALGELRKIFEYFRIIYHREQTMLASGQNEKINSRQQFLAMLDLRQQENQPFHQNDNTPKHYRQIDNTLREFLHDHPKLGDADLLHILAWAVRLAQYRNETQSRAFAVIHPPPPPPPPPPRTLTPPKPGNTLDGIVSGYERGRWLVKLEGGFVVRAILVRGVREPDQGKRVSVRIKSADPDDQESTGEIRRVY